MHSKYDAADCLADIIANVERVESYTAALSRSGFERDGRTRDAVERCMERICEAAFRLAVPWQVYIDAHPELAAIVPQGEPRAS